MSEDRPDWRELTIDEVTERLIDYRGKTPPKSHSGIKLLTAKVVKGGTIDESRLEYIDEEAYGTWMRRGLPQQGDVLLTTEAPLGEVAMLRTPERIALAQRVILLRGDPMLIDQRYLFATLRSPLVQGRLQARATGTTVLGIKQRELRLVKIPVPALALQRKIGAVLSAYDDLIENNTRRIAILEEIAQAMYREWFVEFRYPGHEDVPLVDSEFGPIPKGWRWVELRELAEEIRRSVDPSALDPGTPYFGLGHLPEHSIAISSWGKAADAGSRKYRFEPGEILFGKIRPYFHKVGIPPVTGICSTDAIVIRPRTTEAAGLVLAVVSSDPFVQEAVQTSQGTKMPRANWAVMEQYLVAVPCDDGLVARFGEYMSDAISLLHELIMTNRNLRTTRDLLLPRLISGEVDVSNLDVDVADTAA